MRPPRTWCGRLRRWSRRSRGSARDGGWRASRCAWGCRSQGRRPGRHRQGDHVAPLTGIGGRTRKRGVRQTSRSATRRRLAEEPVARRRGVRAPAAARRFAPSRGCPPPVEKRALLVGRKRQSDGPGGEHAVERDPEWKVLALLRSRNLEAGHLREHAAVLGAAGAGGRGSPGRGRRAGAGPVGATGEPPQSERRRRRRSSAALAERVAQAHPPSLAGASRAGPLPLPRSRAGAGPRW